jgi:hypothetical protein
MKLAEAMAVSFHSRLLVAATMRCSSPFRTLPDALAGSEVPVQTRILLGTL